MMDFFYLVQLDDDLHIVVHAVYGADGRQECRAVTVADADGSTTHGSGHPRWSPSTVAEAVSAWWRQHTGDVEWNRMCTACVLSQRRSCDAVLGAVPGREPHDFATFMVKLAATLVRDAAIDEYERRRGYPDAVDAAPCACGEICVGMLN